LKIKIAQGGSLLLKNLLVIIYSFQAKQISEFRNFTMIFVFAFRAKASSNTIDISDKNIPLKAVSASTIT